MNGEKKHDQVRKNIQKETDWICIFLYNEAFAGVTAYSAVWI